MAVEFVKVVTDDLTGDRIDQSDWYKMRVTMVLGEKETTWKLDVGPHSEDKIAGAIGSLFSGLEPDYVGPERPVGEAPPRKLAARAPIDPEQARKIRDWAKQSAANGHPIRVANYGVLPASTIRAFNEAKGVVLPPVFSSMENAGAGGGGGGFEPVDPDTLTREKGRKVREFIRVVQLELDKGHKLPGYNPRGKVHLEWIQAYNAAQGDPHKYE